MYSFRAMTPFFPFFFFFNRWKHSMAIRALSVMSLPCTKTLCSISITSGRVFLILLAITLVTIFMVTLQRLIGLKFFGEVGFLHFGIRTMKVLLSSLGFPRLFRMLRTMDYTLSLTMYQYFSKHIAESPSGPGAFRG